LQLLSDKSEDEDVEARAGLKKQNDLLQQLLKDDDNVRQHGIMLEVIYCKKIICVCTFFLSIFHIISKV